MRFDNLFSSCCPKVICNSLNRFYAQYSAPNTPMEDRLTQASVLSEQILEGLELETLSTASAALRCMRLARLMNDVDGIDWLQYEISGYPRAQGGKKILQSAFDIGYARGRLRPSSTEDDTKRYIFSELASELEATIAAANASIGSLTTQGVAVEGQYAALALNNLSRNVTVEASTTRQVITAAQQKLAILRGAYHSYALQVSHQLKFGQKSEELFQEYRISVDHKFVSIAPESLNKLAAAYENLPSGNPESWAQALTTCRRVFQELADGLFAKFLDDYADKEEYTTRSGKRLKVTGDKYLNRLSALFDHVVRSGTSLRLQESHLLFVVEYVEHIHDLLCKGVHDSISLDQARFGILHTYIALGDLASQLKDNTTAM